MDASQWIEHAVSLVFGGAGGIAAGLAKLTSSLSKINSRQDAFDTRQDALERRVDVLSAQRREQVRQLADIKTVTAQQVDDIRRQMIAQATLSHELLNNKLEELHKDLADMRTSSAGQQTEIQRSMGEVEGILKMISSNGCARACDRGSSPDLDPPPPFRGSRVPR